MKKAIILGAGFSRSFTSTSPATDELLEILKFYAEQSFIYKTTNLERYLFPSIEKPGLTDFLSYLDIIATTLGSRLHKKYETDIRRYIRNYYLTKVNLPTERKGVLGQYIKRVVSDDTAIINLNWDVIIEQCVDDPKSFIQKCKLIKPHGSVDWILEYLRGLSSRLVDGRNGISPIYRLNDNLKSRTIDSITAILVLLRHLSTRILVF